MLAGNWKKYKIQPTTRAIINFKQIYERSKDLGDQESLKNKRSEKIKPKHPSGCQPAGWWWWRFPRVLLCTTTTTSKLFLVTRTVKNKKYNIRDINVTLTIVWLNERNERCQKVSGADINQQQLVVVVCSAHKHQSCCCCCCLYRREGEENEVVNNWMNFNRINTSRTNTTCSSFYANYCITHRCKSCMRTSKIWDGT